MQRRRAASRAAAEEGVVVDRPGLVGWAAPAGRPPSGRLFVGPGAASTGLTAVLDGLAPLEVVVLDAPGSAGCDDALARRADLTGPEHAVAMLRETLTDLPAASLPAGLTARPVADSPAGCPSLLDAAAAACAADPGAAATFTAPGLAAHLRRTPGAVLVAAVDGDGRVRATAGASSLQGDATVFLVTTDPAWRGRGTATALTASALRAATGRGAVRASLDASAAGRGVYLRLGFVEIGALRCWRRPVR